MKQKHKKGGILTCLLLSGWILFVLLGTNYLEGFYSSVGITKDMITGFGGFICLIFLYYQMLWAIETDPSAKTLDTQVSMIPALAIIISFACVMLTGMEMGSQKVFWYMNAGLFTTAFVIDFSAGNQIGNIILSLKDINFGNGNDWYLKL